MQERFWLVNPSSQTASGHNLDHNIVVADDRFDVLVIGGGAAGLYSALCLPSHLKVALVTKDNLSVSASDWAQGGIAAAIAPEDSPSLHVADTLRAGAGLCEPSAVGLLVEEAHTCIKSLVDLGVAFDRTGEQLALTLEAAHSRKRVLHAADTTGHAIVSTLALQVLKRENIWVFNQTFVLDLWTDEAGCRGVCLSQDLSQDFFLKRSLSRRSLSRRFLPKPIFSASSPPLTIRWVPARAVVLATGGGGQVFSQKRPIQRPVQVMALRWPGGQGRSCVT